jgi:hypothetical protein
MAENDDGLDGVDSENQKDVVDIILIQRTAEGEILMDVDSSLDEFSCDRAIGMLGKSKFRVASLPLNNLLQIEEVEGEE